MVSRISRRVAVIGGGSAGVVTARFLAEAGHRPVLFEAAPSLGGIWSASAENKVVYSNLRTNLPTLAMQSPDLDFPPGLPSYIDADTLGRYIQAYADTFGVTARTRFNARTTSVAPNASDESWRVRWVAGEGAEEQEQDFEAVAVCTGHYSCPYTPDIPGQHEWLAGDARRRIVHSKYYNEPSEFKGQHVLVVGGRSSGVDIARELRDVATHVYVLDKSCKTSRRVGRCTHVPLGTRLQGDGQLSYSVDGSDTAINGPAVSTVILATGYEYAFPFLAQDMLDMTFEGQRHVTPLYQHLLHARRPALGFVGIPLSVPCPIPFFESQAKYLAAHWATPGGLSTEAERVAWVEARLEVVGERLGDTHYTKLAHAEGDAWSYMRELVARAGSTGEEYQRYCRRLKMVEAIYMDRVQKRPQLPWDQDWYRRCEYTADWATGEWAVRDPEQPTDSGVEPEPAPHSML